MSNWKNNPAMRHPARNSVCCRGAGGIGAYRSPVGDGKSQYAAVVIDAAKPISRSMGGPNDAKT